MHPDFGKLASRVSVTKLHKETKSSFFEVIKQLYFYTDSTGNSLKKNFNVNVMNYYLKSYVYLSIGANASLISKDVYQIIEKNYEQLEAAIDYKRDWDYDYFGFKTLERAYLLKVISFSLISHRFMES